MSAVLNWELPYEKYFEEICQYPHGSYHEQLLSNHLAEFAAGLSLAHRQDDLGNVVIYKDGTPGYENHPPLIIQSHIDMICEKRPGCEHDFEKDPLELYVEDRWIRARGTTLGGDDGVGAAYMMAVLADRTMKHPPLECLFTVQEEVGCIGAAHLKASDFKGVRLLGLDEVSGNATTVSGAGMKRVVAVYSAVKERALNDRAPGEKTPGKNAPGAAGAAEAGEHPMPERPALHFYELTVSGLIGGHSGDDIHKERGNANKLAARLLFGLMEGDSSLQLASIDGGTVDNAISRACTMVLATGREYAGLCRDVDGMIKAMREELRYSDAGLLAEVKACGARPVFSVCDSGNIAKFLYICPDGFRHRSMHLELTTASSNMGVLRTEGGNLTVSIYIRGASTSLIDTITGEIMALAGILDWESQVRVSLPCWEYREDSPLRAQLKVAYTTVTGAQMREHAEHGCLEAGHFTAMKPEMDIATLGPCVKGYHTFDECVDRASFAQIYEVLTALLERL